MNEDFILNYQPFPGNVPDKGYVPVSTRASKDAPSTSDMWEYVKLEQVTDKDKEQIETNKQNIELLQDEVENIETALDDKSTVSGKNDGTNWTKITINGEEKNIPAGGGGGGFTPTQAQLDAMNSGIDSSKVEQIAENANDITDINAELADKVDKVAGKGLSTNDYTNADKTKLDGIDMSTKQDVLSTAQLNAVNSGIDATKVAQIQTNTDDIANKVNKETGKGLSTNDYTNAEKNKVALINSTETLVFTLQDDTTVTLKLVTGV